MILTVFQGLGMFKKTRKKIKALSFQHPQATERFEHYFRSSATGAYWLRRIVNSLFLLKSENRRPLNQNHDDYVRRMLDFNHKHIVILAQDHVTIVAHLMKQCLKKVGIAADIIGKPPEKGFSDALHIVVCPQAFQTLPRDFIGYQMEQIAISDRYRSKRYQDIVCNALAIMDYSLTNCEFLINNWVPKERVFYLPIYSGVKEEPSKDLPYDVLFYGDIHSPRRKKLLDQLKRDFNVKIAFKVWGEKKFEELRKAKVIVNLHFYENALLESTRIFECLQLGKPIVSEEGIDQVTYGHLNGILDFVPPGDYEQLKAKLSYLLQDNHLASQMQILQTKLAAQPDWFALYFYRVLLSLDVISFDTFYEAIGKNLNISDNLTVKTTEFEELGKTFSTLNNDGRFFESLRHYNPQTAQSYTLNLIERIRKEHQVDAPHIEISDKTKDYWG